MPDVTSPAGTLPQRAAHKRLAKRLCTYLKRAGLNPLGPQRALEVIAALHGTDWNTLSARPHLPRLPHPAVTQALIESLARYGVVFTETDAAAALQVDFVPHARWPDRLFVGTARSGRRFMPAGSGPSTADAPQVPGEADRPGLATWLHDPHVITGSAGSGKSYALAEFVAAAERNGQSVVVVAGACHPEPRPPGATTRPGLTVDPLKIKPLRRTEGEDDA